jgi:hypothetical protein
MTPPIPFFVPSGVSIIQETSFDSHPLAIISDTPAELLIFAIVHAQQHPDGGRYVLITAQDKAMFASTLSSSLLTSPASPLTSTRAIIASNRITLYHVETLAHLRVLLSHLQHERISFIGLDKILSLHESASEISAQGISRTIAATIHITSMSKGILAMREPREMVERSIPILNAGVSSNFSHSTAPMLRVLGRWIRGFWTQIVHDEGECQAEWRCRGETSQITWTLNDGEIDDVQISDM